MSATADWVQHVQSLDITSPCVIDDQLSLHPLSDWTLNLEEGAPTNPADFELRLKRPGHVALGVCTVVVEKMVIDLVVIEAVGRMVKTGIPRTRGGEYLTRYHPGSALAQFNRGLRECSVCNKDILERAYVAIGGTGGRHLSCGGSSLETKLLKYKSEEEARASRDRRTYDGARRRSGGHGHQGGDGFVRM